MAEIIAALVKALRERTGTGMMDCKRALSESGGDIEAAADWLRTKGLAAAAKKAGRVAAEGLVALAVESNNSAIVEVNSETDFVARNDLFQGLVTEIAQLALANGGDFERTCAAAFPAKDRTVAEEVAQMVGTIGENLQFRRSTGLSVGTGVIGSYVHAAASPGAGRIGVLVALESESERQALGALAKQLAMHVAATNPQAVAAEDLDPALVEHERQIVSEQARQEGKPDEIVAKIVEGRMKKFRSEVVLTEQIFVIDNETPVAAVLEDAGGEAGVPVRIAGFVRYELGEGAERKQGDFAEEVEALRG